jgi:hypothetical protein
MADVRYQCCETLGNVTQFAIKKSCKLEKYLKLRIQIILYLQNERKINDNDFKKHSDIVHKSAKVENLILNQCLTLRYCFWQK